MDISRRLVEIRDNKEYSLEKLSEEMGVSKDIIASWEDGSKNPDIDSLMKLSKVYGMSIDEILSGGSNAPEYNESKAVYYNQSDIDEKKRKVARQASMAASGKLSLILFPILLMVVYVCLGAFMDLWHPGWIVLLAIPVYYLLVFLLNKLGDNVESAVDEFVKTNEAEKESNKR